MVAVWGATWRMDIRRGCTEEDWRDRGKEFVQKVAEDWGIRGLVQGKGKKEEGGRKKGEEEEGKGDDKKNYTHHESDRVWKDVGKRCKLVVDSQITARLLNRQVRCKSGKYEAMVRRTLNMQYQIVKSGWLPFIDHDDILEWRRRKYNKIADHIANESMKFRKNSLIGTRS